jgi:hypothetical protein
VLGSTETRRTFREGDRRARSESAQASRSHGWDLQEVVYCTMRCHSLLAALTELRLARGQVEELQLPSERPREQHSSRRRGYSEGLVNFVHTSERPPVHRNTSSRFRPPRGSQTPHRTHFPAVTKGSLSWYGRLTASSGSSRCMGRIIDNSASRLCHKMTRPPFGDRHCPVV